MLLLMGSCQSLQAQDKYDIAVVCYFQDVPNSLILVSLNGEKFEQYEVQKAELGGKPWGISMNPLIAHVNKMQAQGWEAVGGMQASGLPDQSMFYFTMRKKKG